jgi:hypothetical protein
MCCRVVARTTRRLYTWSCAQLVTRLVWSLLVMVDDEDQAMTVGFGESTACCGATEWLMQKASARTALATVRGYNLDAPGVGRMTADQP